jgi:hypothetical protein
MFLTVEYPPTSGLAEVSQQESMVKLDGEETRGRLSGLPKNRRRVLCGTDVEEETP